MLSEGQYIVYPLHGVGKIEKIQKRLNRGVDNLYYVIYFEESELTIMVPVAKSDELGIRPVSSKVTADKALNELSEEVAIITDWKIRYQTNIDLLKTGDIINIVKVVGTFYRRSKEQDLPILERKIYDNAYDTLRDELVISLELSKVDTEKLILDMLNK